MATNIFTPSLVVKLFIGIAKIYQPSSVLSGVRSDLILAQQALCFPYIYCIMCV